MPATVLVIQTMRKMRLQQEQQQQEAERRRLDMLAEERQQQLLRKEQMEQESVQTWLRIRDEMIQKAAAGDPHAIRVMEQFKDIIDDTPTPKAPHE